MNKENNPGKSENKIEYLLKFTNPSWSKGYDFPVVITALGMLLLLTPIILSILVGKLNYVTIFGPVVSIPFFILAIFTWPYIPCTIQILSDHLIFNKKSSTRLYNPNVQINYTEIQKCEYLEEERKLVFIMKSEQKRFANLSGAKNEDIERLITILEKKKVLVSSPLSSSEN